MKTTPILLTLSALFLVSSCNRQNKLPEIILFSASQQENCCTIPLKTIACRVDVIPLNTQQEMLGKVTALFETDSSFYIISDDKNVSEYTKAGEFIRKIGAQGRGPGEYLYPKNLYFGKDSILSVFDYNTQQILRYNSAGTVVSTIALSFEQKTIYLDTFFPANDTLIFQTSGNASGIELFAFQPTSKKLAPISRKDREMIPDEVIMGHVFSFGGNQNPFIYNSFNDTVFILKNQKLSPSFLLKQEKYRFDFKELTIEKLMNLSDKRIRLQWIGGSNRYLFISYTLLNAEGRKSKNFLAFYDIHNETYSQNTRFIAEDSLAIIHENSKLYNGISDNELLKVEYSGDNNESVSIIKYTLQ